MSTHRTTGQVPLNQDGPEASPPARAREDDDSREAWLAHYRRRTREFLADPAPRHRPYDCGHLEPWCRGQCGMRPTR